MEVIRRKREINAINEIERERETERERDRKVLP